MSARQVPLGKLATKRAWGLLHGQRAGLESAPSDGGLERDGYEWLLAYVRLADGRGFELSIVARGLCVDYGLRYPHLRGEEYERTERRRRGILDSCRTHLRRVGSTMRCLMSLVCLVTCCALSNCDSPGGGASGGGTAAVSVAAIASSSATRVPMRSGSSVGDGAPQSPHTSAGKNLL